MNSAIGGMGLGSSYLQGHLSRSAMLLHLLWATPILPSSWVIKVKCNSVWAEDVEATAFSVVEMTEVIVSPVSHDESKEVRFTIHCWRQFHDRMLYTG